MKILHVVQSLRHSGAEMLVRDLAIVHAKQGVEVAVVALQPADPKFSAEMAEMEAQGIQVFSPSGRRGRISRILGVHRACKRFRPDVIFAHSALPAIYGRMGAWWTGAPVLPVLHAPDDYANPRLRMIEKFLRHRAYPVVSVAEAAVKNYQERIGDPEPIVIKNGIELSKFEFSLRQRDEGREILALKDEEIAILQLGRIQPNNKGQDLSLAACKEMLKQDSRIKLIFVGIVENADFKIKAQLQCEQDGIASQVQFTGPLGNVSKLLAGADLFVMPSHYEAHSVALLEALQSGIPIVASAIESFFPYEAFEGIELVNTNDVRVFREKIINALGSLQRFRRDLSAFSIEVTARKYLDLAQSVR